MDNNTNHTQFQALITITGFAFLAAGAYVFYFILTELLKIFTHVESSLFLSKVSQALSDKVLYIGPDASPVTIGNGASLMIAFFFLIALTSCAGSIALSLIKAGTHLLSPNIKTDIKKLKEKVNNLTHKGQT